MPDFDSYDNFLSVLMFETFQQHPNLKITPSYAEDWIEVNGDIVDLESTINLEFSTVDDESIEISQELKNRWECKVGNWFKSFRTLTDYDSPENSSIRADNFQNILKKNFDFTEHQIQEAKSFIEQRDLKEKFKDVLETPIKNKNITL